VFLSGWWSAKYSRPLNNPLLQQYSLEELLYEYFLHLEKDIVAEENQKEAEDKVETDKIDAGEAWADQMEAEFEEEMAREAEEREKEEWMKKQLEAEESQEFKEDLSINFEE